MSFKAPDSLAEQIAQHLGQEIITGKLKPGDRIQELRIASELNVSRGSVREAFLILDRRFLIDMVPRKGAVVSQMSANRVKSIYEAIAVNMGAMGRKAAEKWKDNELDDFIAIVEKMGKFVEKHQVVEYYEATFEFYREAYRFLDNEFLENIMEDLLPAIKRAYYLALNIEPAELQEALQFFNGVLTTVLNHDSSGVQAVIDDYCEHQCKLVLAAIGKDNAA